jgi:hypothetical protein
LVNAIERKPSAALSKRLAEREAQLETLRAEIKRLRERAAESESKVVTKRAERLSKALKHLTPGTVAAANSALRECIEAVIVDYTHGTLRLKWRHGPTTTLDYWPLFTALDAS